jgi:hypothetical protein
MTNRDAIGAKATLSAGNGLKLLRMVKTGSSYASQSELPLIFGMSTPAARKAAALDIVWPSGKYESLSKITVNQFITLKEASGIISAKSIVFRR